MNGPCRWVLLALLYFSTSAGIAQEIKFFSLDEDRQGYLEFRFRNRNETRREANTDSLFDLGELEIAERVGFQTGGYFYHPLLLNFTAEGIFELQHDFYSGNVWDKEQQHRPFVGGDFELKFLEKHPYSLTFKATRQEIEVEQMFARSYPLLTEAIGTTFSFNKGPLPFQVSYSHRNSEGFGAGADIDETWDEFRFSSNFGNGINSRGKAEYYRSKALEVIRQTKLNRQGFAVSHSWTPRSSGAMRLTSQLRGYEQDDQTQSSNISLNEQLSWNHTGSLSSRYNFGLERNMVSQQGVKNIRLRGAVNHRLYSSLQSEFEAKLLHQSATYGTERRVGGRLTEAYTKRLADWSRISLVVGATAEVTDRTRNETTGIVVDEPHVLVREVPSTLKNFDIETSSIIVTDDRGLIHYVEDEDYRIIIRGPVTEIARLALGEIPDGASVLVDYRYQLQGPGEVSSTGGNLAARLDIQRWLSLEMMLNRMVQRQVSGPPSSRLENLNHRIWRVRANWGWVSADVEYQDRDSNFAPFRGDMERLQFSFEPLPLWRVVVTGGRYGFWYTLENERTQGYTLHALLSAGVTVNSSLDLEANFWRETWREQSENNLRNRGLKLSYVWRLYDLQLVASVRISDLQQRGIKENINRVFVSLRRSF